MEKKSSFLFIPCILYRYPDTILTVWHKEDFRKKKVTSSGYDKYIDCCIHKTAHGHLNRLTNIFHICHTMKSFF